MKIIVAVDKNFGIGCDGKLLMHISEDMKFFKATTIGNVVVMGKRTFESLPKGLPLIDRVNIVLSRDKNFQNEAVTICRSLDELFIELKKFQTDSVFVIGGESIYTQLLPYSTDAYVTKIEDTFPADKHFTNLDTDCNWELAETSEEKTHNDITFYFTKYKNKHVKQQ